MAKLLSHYRTNCNFASARLVGIFMPALAIVAVGCAKTLPTYRYRLTVELETPQGLRTGSSVIEIQESENSKYAPGEASGKVISKMRGEAVAIDVPDGRTVFALLSTPNQVDGAKHYAPAGLTPEMWKSGQVGNLYPPRIPLTQRVREYPRIVMFKDMSDPTTVVDVDPDDVSKALGTGYRLRRITVQLTDEPVKFTIDKYLNRLGLSKGQRLSKKFGRLSFDLKDVLGYDDFKAGDAK